jgi:predicted cytidylate kinase
MMITIGGPPGSGKTTVAKLLSQKLDMALVVIGEIFRSLAKEKGYTLSEFGEIASSDHSIDIELDKRTIEKARQDNLVLEGRLAGVMLQKNDIPSFKIWLDADITERAKRIAQRDGGEIEDVISLIRKREQCELDRYQEIYGVKLTDKNIYDLIIDTTDISSEKVVDIILDALEV